MAHPDKLGRPGLDVQFLTLQLYRYILDSTKNQTFYLYHRAGLLYQAEELENSESLVEPERQQRVFTWLSFSLLALSNMLGGFYPHYRFHIFRYIFKDIFLKEIFGHEKKFKDISVDGKEKQLFFKMLLHVDE